MTQEHTPSPWKWDWRHDDGVTCSGSVFSETNKGHAYAVAICPRYQSKEQWAADATLIAAAPDLLAALRQFVAACDTAPPISLIKELSMACVVAKAAIAKANGETK